MTKQRLIAGTINDYRPGPGWQNTLLDKSDRLLPGGARVHIVADVKALPIDDDTYDEVRSWQVLEHLFQADGMRAVAEFFRVLKPGGVLDIEVPDLDGIVSAWIDGSVSRHELTSNLYGDGFVMPDQDLNVHRWGYTEETLYVLLSKTGFEVGDRLMGDGPLQLRFRTVKP